MSGFTSSERCLILLELAEKIAMEDPKRRKLHILHEDGRKWQVVLDPHHAPNLRNHSFPPSRQALEILYYTGHDPGYKREPLTDRSRWIQSLASATVATR